MIKGTRRPGARPKKNYRTQADRRFSIAIRGIGYCENCGAVEFLQTAHVHSRAYAAVRVDFENAVCLCRGCHVFFTMRPLEWEDWGRARLGAELWEGLRRRAVAGAKMDWKVEAQRLLTDVPALRAPPVAPR